MKAGDFVRLKNGETPRNGRGVGIVLKHDIYKFVCTYKDGGRAQEQITRVLWNTGKTGWVLTRRIELITCK